MTFRSCLRVSALCLVAGFTTAATAHANTISGTAYCNIASNSGGNGSGFAIHTPSLSELPTAIATSGGKCATFTASELDFATNAGSGNDTIAGFLNSFGKASNIQYFNGKMGSSSFDGTLIVFTASAYLVNGQSYTVSHDDGTNIYVDGQGFVLSPDQTVAIPTSYKFMGTTGTHDLEFIYNSNYTAPAVYVTDLANTSPVPEPGSLTLLGTGALAAAGAVRRRILR